MKQVKKKKTFSTWRGKYANDNKFRNKICRFSQHIVYLKRLKKISEWNKTFKNKIWKILTIRVADHEAISLLNNYSIGFQAQIIQFNRE